jgi:hypothetical protein
MITLTYPWIIRHFHNCIGYVIVNHELERMWKELSLSQNMSGGNEKYKEKSQTCWAVTWSWYLLDASKKSKKKAVPLHAMEALGGRGGIAPTHS